MSPARAGAARTPSTGGGQPGGAKRPAPGDTQRVLLVTMCTGSRCAGLRRLATADPTAAHRCPPDLRPDQDRQPGKVQCPEGTAPGGVGVMDAVLRSAVAHRRDAVLVTTDCLGACSRGSVTAVGWASSTVGGLSWLSQPVWVERSETPRRARALAQWVGSTAPDPATIPPILHTR